MDEFGLIERYFTRPTQRASLILGIGDDAALFDVRHLAQLAVTTDTLVSGVHFPDGADGFDVGYKALAVNVSDLAAMGAEPVGFLLNLALPVVDHEWLGRFQKGLFTVADQFAMALAGGDTVCAPLSITITALGTVPDGQALRRTGAKVGDRVYVSGFLGEAALGFLLRTKDLSVPKAFQEQILTRLDRPVPRVAEGIALRSIASSAIDLSDGLVADLGHILRASRVGAEIDLRRLPLSDAYHACFGEVGYEPALGFGDDYELCFTVPPDRLRALENIAPCFMSGFHYIGDITVDQGLCFQGDHGSYVPKMTGFNHFHD